LISIASAAIFRHAGKYRPLLIVLVSTLAFEAGNFAASARNGTPFVTTAFGGFLVDLPQSFCVIKRDWHVAFS
jgi:hypothetical protein